MALKFCTGTNTRGCHPCHSLTAIENEVACRRFSEPFADLLPGMYSAPMHVVPKPRTNPPKYRLVHDYSASTFSCNSMIPKQERSMPLDTVQHLGQKI